jgi:hypothetical protein
MKKEPDMSLEVYGYMQCQMDITEVIYMKEMELYKLVKIKRGQLLKLQGIERASMLNEISRLVGAQEVLRDLWLAISSLSSSSVSQ